MPKLRAVAYLRVSTTHQGQSGLGLEAQRVAINAYLSTTNYVVDREFIEIESGKKGHRQQLRNALDYCLKVRATLLIAKLERLARNVAFVAALLESRAKFIAVDMPDADKTFLHLAAVFAEWEGRMISERTKAALAAAKARGQKLGFPTPTMQRTASTKGNETLRRYSDEFALKSITSITGIMAAGAISAAGVARALNSLGVPTLRAGRWHGQTVNKVIARVRALENMS